MHRVITISSKFLFLLYLGLTQFTLTQAADETMSKNETIIREFVAAWSNLDADELATYFTDDGVYYNMPTQPISGRDNVKAFIGNFIGPWESTDWEILNIIAEGDIVMVERMDHTVAAGKQIELPCFGIFEMENGKIKVWRDYFNLATYTSALTGSN
jgi:limonene-1,2-epoxide hydrolase